MIQPTVAGSNSKQVLPKCCTSLSRIWQPKALLPWLVTPKGMTGHWCLDTCFVLTIQKWSQPFILLCHSGKVMTKCILILSKVKPGVFQYAGNRKNCYTQSVQILIQTFPTSTMATSRVHSAVFRNTKLPSVWGERGLISIPSLCPSTTA